MNESSKPAAGTAEGDVVLKEIWQAKDTLSAAYGHDLRRLIAESRDRQKRSGHPVVDFSRKNTASDR